MPLDDSVTTLSSTSKIGVVVFHQGALGDFLMAASAIENLAEFCAAARVDFWSKPEHVSLLTGKGYLGACHPVDSPLVASLLHDSLWQTVALPDFLLKADLVFIFGQTGSRAMAGRLAGRLSANVSWIQSFPSADSPGIHVSHFLSRQLKELGWPIDHQPLRLSPPAAEKQAAKELLHDLGISSPPILIHPGSGGRRKVWPLRNWHGLIDWMQSQLSCQTLLSIGPADEYMIEFSRTMREAEVPTVTGLTAIRLSALLSLCALYIGSDSGVSHLAAAVGIPTIAVFGPTDPDVWGPPGDNVAIVRRRWEESDILGEKMPDRDLAGTQSEVRAYTFEDKEITDLVLAMVHG